MKENSLHIPEKVLKIEKAFQARSALDQSVNKLADEIYLDLTDGWSSGNPVKDFALAATGGHPDEDELWKYENILTQTELCKNDFIMIYVQTVVEISGEPVVQFSFQIGISNGVVDFDHHKDLMSFGIQNSTRGLFMDHVDHKNQHIIPHAYIDKKSDRITLTPLMNQYRPDDMFFDAGHDSDDPIYQPRFILFGKREILKVFSESVLIDYRSDLLKLMSAISVADTGEDIILLNDLKKQGCA